MNQFQAFGSCYPNKGNKIMDISGRGPLVVAVRQFISEVNDEDFLLNFLKQDSDGRFTTVVVSAIGGTDQETAVADEDTGYDGDGSEINFTGEALDDLPVLPGSVVVEGLDPAPDLKDWDGDGILYSDDDDAEASGTVDYETGAITLAYSSVAKAPGVGDILANYYQGTWLTTLGNRLIELTGTPLRDSEMIRILGLSKKSVNKSVRVEVNAVFGW